MVSSGVVRKFGLSGTELYRARLLIEKGSRAALNKFLTIYTPVVYLIARQYTLDTRLQREYIRAGNVGLLVALEKANGKKGDIAFYTSLAGNIRSAIRAYIVQSHQVLRLPYLFLGMNEPEAGEAGIAVLSVTNTDRNPCPLTPGDKLTEIDGVAVNTLEDVNRMLEKLRKGDIFRITYSRANVIRNAFLNCVR